MSQEKCIKKVPDRFGVQNTKPRNIPLGSYLKLLNKQSPKTNKEWEHMTKVPNMSDVDSFMYAMVCTGLYIAHVVRVVNEYNG